MPRRALTVLLCCFALSSVARGQIQLTIRADVTPHPGQLAVRLLLQNQGKEEARRVQIHLSGSGDAVLPPRPSLPPGASHEDHATMELPETAAPGRYPLYVTVGYTDSNGYPFSAVLCAPYSLQEETTSEIFGTLQAEPLADEAGLRLQLKNLASRERSFTLRIFTPRELSAGPPQEVKLGPGEERELSIAVRNFSALPGSRYPIYAVAEYDADGRHFTNMILGHVDTVARTGLFTQYRNWLLVAAGLLLAAGAGVVVSHWSARRRPGMGSPGG